MENIEVQINDAIHCVKVELEESVCEECRLYGLCHTYCKDVIRIKLQALEKLIPKEPINKTIALDNGNSVGLIGRCPNCGTVVSYIDDFCEECHRELRW